jgi:hypothetical protein
MLRHNKQFRLNDQLRHAFRTGSLPPSHEAEQSFEAERRLESRLIPAILPRWSLEPSATFEKRLIPFFERPLIRPKPFQSIAVQLDPG